MGNRLADKVVGLRGHDDWMSLALELAAVSEGAKIAALVVKDNKLISSGQSLARINSDPTAHAEINAIRSAAGNFNNPKLNGCILYSTLEPCAMCLHASAWACVDLVVFGADHTVCSPALYDRKKYSAIEAAKGITCDHNGEGLPIIGGVCAERSAELLKDYRLTKAS